MDTSSSSSTIGFIEAPIFRPTEDQFKLGPANYIHGISKYHPSLACCVIVPPQNFNPYFSLDQDTFRFKTIKQDFLSNNDVPGGREFTFREYHRMGDAFKADYFGKPPNMVPQDDIDENFWTLVTQGEDVAIFSAHRLSTKVHGSGFPNKTLGPLLTKDDEKYLDHPWNLLNVIESDDNLFSVLESQLDQNVAPTLDIGMCFSHRGWRKDIHWSYSINYMHCGDTKLWYAISGENSQWFESKINSESTPLPINLVGETAITHETFTDYSKITKRKVKVYRAELQPGHFLVTFPSSYYMTYDTGVNVVESVVIAPINWLSIGFKAVEHLCDNNQAPFFSHEELISKLACDAEFLDINTLKEILCNFEYVIDQELILRKVIDIYPDSIKHQRQAFELIPISKRRCFFCANVIFLSAFTCECDSLRFVCLKHANNLCDKCPQSEKIYRYRYTEDELKQILENIKGKIYEFDKWKKEVNSLLNGNTSQAPIEILRNLFDEAEEKFYPQDSPELIKLYNILQEYDHVDKIVQELLDQQNKYAEEENHKRVKYQSSLVQSSARIKKKMETEKDESKHGGGNSVKVKILSARNSESEEENRKLTVSEFTGFCEVIDNYPFQVSGTEHLKKLLSRCNEIDKSISDILDENLADKIDSNKLDNLIQEANSISFICFDRKLEALRDKLEEVKWLEDCFPILDHDSSKSNATRTDLIEVKALIESGLNLKSPSIMVKSQLNRLNIVYEEANKWLDAAKETLNTIKQNNLSSFHSEKLSLDHIECLLKPSRENPGLKAIDLNPSLQQLEDVFTKCQTWLKKAEDLMISLHVGGMAKDDEANDIPYSTQLEELYNQGKTIGCHFEVLKAMKASLELVNEWKEKVNKTFLRRNSLYSIINILAPRSNYSLPLSIDIMNGSSRSIYQSLRKFSSQSPAREGSKRLTGFEKQLTGDFSAEKISQIYHQAELEEESEIQIIREKNIKKNNQIANNEATMGDEDNGNSLGTNYIASNSDKDGKSNKERDRSSKKFCFCGKPAIEWMVQCQLCQEWFHISCVSSYLPFVNLVAKGRKQLTISNSEDVVDQFNFLCILCCRGKRPSLEHIQDLIYSYAKLPTRTLEGELIICLTRRVQKYQEKVLEKIDSHPDLAKGYEIAERNCWFIEESSNHELNILDSPSKNKRKAPIVLRKDLTECHGVALSHESRTILWDLICEGNLIEANVPEVQNLWTIMLIINPNLKTLVFINPNTASLAKLASSTFMIGSNRRNPESDDGNEGESVEPDASKSRLKRKRRDRGMFERSVRRKSRKNKNDKDSPADADAEPDLCSLNDLCLRPEGREVDWIFCEGKCQQWLHQLCAGISDPGQVAHLDKYICASCQSQAEIEGTSTRSGKVEDSKIKRHGNKIIKSSKNSGKENVRSQIGSTSVDDETASPKSMRGDCEQGRGDEQQSNTSVLDRDHIEIGQVVEQGINETLQLCDIPKVIDDDEETTSCLSEDRVYHDTSFESVEESGVTNVQANVDRASIPDLVPNDVKDDQREEMDSSQIQQHTSEQPVNEVELNADGTDYEISVECSEINKVEIDETEEKQTVNRGDETEANDCLMETPEEEDRFSTDDLLESGTISLDDGQEKKEKKSIQIIESPVTEPTLNASVDQNKTLDN